MSAVCRQVPDNGQTLKKGYDKFPMTGKGDFDILNVHSCHVETVVLMSRVSNEPRTDRA